MEGESGSELAACRGMRISHLSLVLAAAVGLVSCNRTADHREEPVARQVGKEAYSASQDIKRGAKKAAKEIRKAGKEFREGWSERRTEEKHPDPPPPRK
jgi:hypothetical protein